MQLLQCSALLPGATGQCNSCFALPRYQKAMGSETPDMHCHTARGKWAMELLQCTASLPGSQWALQLLQCTALTASGQWAVGLLQRAATLPSGSGQCNSCNTLHSLLEGSGQWNYCNELPHYQGLLEMPIVQCTASSPRGSAQWDSFHALPHCPRALGSGTCAMQCLTAQGQWAVQLLQCIALTA